MKDQPRELDQFFEGLFRDLKPVFYWRHPSERAWREYLEQARGKVPLSPEELLRWKGSQLQLCFHLLTCGRCARRVTALRNESGQRISAKWKLLQPTGYSVLLALTIAAVIWFAIPHPTAPPLPPSDLRGSLSHLI